MLFVLTGNVQTGKTRWLEALVGELERADITPYGVIAPGVWLDRRSVPDKHPRADSNGFEKVGIDNILLPSRERISFAERTDLARKRDLFDENSQSAQAKLGWHIREEAIARVNEHFKSIKDVSSTAGGKGFLVTDELGRLELERGEGIHEALHVLEEGPTGNIEHALVVVRESLLPCLEGRYASWGARVEIKPDEQSWKLVMGA